MITGTITGMIAITVGARGRSGSMQQPRVVPRSCETDVTKAMLAIVSKNAYSACMFENGIDTKEIRTALTDAGHTAAGFAALAAKRAAEVRTDLTERYETQIAESRKVALDVVNRLEDVRTTIEARVEPVVAKMTERLPEPAQKVIADMTEARKAFQVKAHEFVVKAITVELPKAKAPAAKATTAKARKASPKAAPKAKATAPKAARKPRTPKVAVSA